MTYQRQKWLSNPEHARPSALCHVAAYMMANGLNAEAIEYYSEAIRSGLVTPEAFWRRGHAYREMGQWQSAAENLLLGLDEKKASDVYVCAIVTCKSTGCVHAINNYVGRMLRQMAYIPQIENASERWNITFSLPGLYFRHKCYGQIGEFKVESQRLFKPRTPTDAQ